MSLAAEGYQISHRRVPMSRERTPQPADVDHLLSQVCVCGGGGGGIMSSSLLRLWLLLLLLLFSCVAVQLCEGHLGRPSGAPVASLRSCLLTAKSIFAWTSPLETDAEPTPCRPPPLASADGLGARPSTSGVCVPVPICSWEQRAFRVGVRGHTPQAAGERQGEGRGGGRVCVSMCVGGRGSLAFPCHTPFRGRTFVCLCVCVLSE